MKNNEIPLAATVNGRGVAFLSSPALRLSETLRDELGLTGTKVGCDAGDCGACTASGYCWESSAALATAAAEAGYCWESSAAVATTAAGTSAAAATGANDEASGMNDMVWG